jgi:hypothetical protein
VSWDPDGPLPDDEPLARPFLARPDVLSPGPDRYRPPVRTGGQPPAGSGGLHAASEGSRGEVRPYLLTGGRTRTRVEAVAMETVVIAAGTRPLRTSTAAGRERCRIVELAQCPCSVAELAAWLRLPLQVALVLVGDLVEEGTLEASRATVRQSEDVHFLERLIAGVAAL